MAFNGDKQTFNTANLGTALNEADRAMTMNDRDKANFNNANLGADLNGGNHNSLIDSIKNSIEDWQTYFPEAGVYENLAPIYRRRVDALRELQAEHDKLEAKFFGELADLEAKYQKLYQPLYAKRCEIVNGLVEVEGNISRTAQKQDEEEEEKGVPDFWLTALKTSEEIADEISERDEDALAYLNDIKYSRLSEPKGFKLDFFFDSNPYFANNVLSKTYHMVDEYEPMLEKATGTTIDWLPGQCLTENTLLRIKPKKESMNSEDSISFFNFFSPPEVPEETAKLNAVSSAALQYQMEQDYEIGSIIRDDIIPHAVYWYTREAIPGNELDLDNDDDNITIYGDDSEDEDGGVQIKVEGGQQ